MAMGSLSDAVRGGKQAGWAQSVGQGTCFAAAHGVGANTVFKIS
jgi:hypothetical protein